MPFLGPGAPGTGPRSRLHYRSEARDCPPTRLANLNLGLVSPRNFRSLPLVQATASPRPGPLNSQPAARSHPAPAALAPVGHFADKSLRSADGSHARACRPFGPTNPAELVRDPPHRVHPRRWQPQRWAVPRSCSGACVQNENQSLHPVHILHAPCTPRAEHPRKVRTTKRSTRERADKSTRRHPT